MIRPPDQGSSIIIRMQKISIITIVWNNKTFIEESLQSQLSQTYPHVERIVVDGGSTDGTLEIIKRFSSRIDRIITGPDRGIYDALNKGIQAATGDIIGLLHSDDLFSDQDTLYKVHEELDDDGLDACYGDLLYVDRYDTSKIVRYWHSGTYHPRRFHWGWMPPHPTFFAKRSVYEKYGLFNLDMGSAADYELLLRYFVKYRIRTAYIPEVLVKMRIGGTSNASLTNRILANRNDRKAWEINGLRPYPWTLLLKPVRKIPQYFLRP